MTTRRRAAGPAGDPAGLALFDTAIGRCGVAWRGEAIVGVQLPEGSDAATLGRLATKAGVTPTETDPPSVVLDAVAGMMALLDGDDVDLGWVTVAAEHPDPLHRAVWDVTRTIPRGSVLTYGAVADRIGRPGAAQAVGRALGANPCPIVIPCHRVVGADGALTGFSAAGGTETKRRMLLIEDCPAVAPSLFDDW